MCTRLGLFHQEAQARQHEFLRGVKSLENLLADGQAALGDQIAQAQSTVKSTASETVFAIQHTLSSSARQNRASLKAGQVFLDRRIDGLQKDLAQRHTSLDEQITRYTREIENKLERRFADMEGKIATLVIAGYDESGITSLLGGHSVQEILLPLTRMQQTLVPFLSELVESKKIQMSRQDLDDIHAQFTELLASCYEVSAADLRRNLKARFQKSADVYEVPRSTMQASDFSLRSRHRSSKAESNGQRRFPEPHIKRFLMSPRSRLWTKQTTHGLLTIWFYPGRESIDYCRGASSSIFACANFIPYPWVGEKCVTISFLRMLQATHGLIEFCPIHTFNSISIEDPIIDALRKDDITALQQCMSERRFTAWDVLVFSPDANDSYVHKSLLAVRSSSFPYFPSC